MGNFVGCGLLCEVHDMNAVARSDREDCEDGERGETLLLLADGVAEVGVACVSKPVQSGG